MNLAISLNGLLHHLPSGNQIYLHLYFSYVIAGVRDPEKGTGIRKRYKLCTKSYVTPLLRCCRSSGVL